MMPELTGLPGAHSFLPLTGSCPGSSSSLLFLKLPKAPRHMCASRLLRVYTSGQRGGGGHVTHTNVGLSSRVPYKCGFIPTSHTCASKAARHTWRSSVLFPPACVWCGAVRRTLLSEVGCADWAQQRMPEWIRSACGEHALAKMARVTFFYTHLTPHPPKQIIPRQVTPRRLLRSTPIFAPRTLLHPQQRLWLGARGGGTQRHSGSTCTS